MQALRRLVARRGPVAKMWSDNGTNFTGTANQLKRIYNEEVATHVVSRKFNIKWHFITPYAPHHGGLHEAAVESVNKHLLRVISAQNLTFEEYSTLLTQVEACVNSRPIAPLTDDPRNLNGTPAHFLIGEPLVTLTEPRDLSEVRPTHLKRWEMVQQMSQNFWKRWHDEYIMMLSQTPKWRENHRNLRVGDLVIITAQNTAPSQWESGRIVEVFPGKDGIVRTVMVKSSTGVYTRPITKLGRLPVNDDDQNEKKNFERSQNGNYADGLILI